ncbi:reverse transcriptase domain-containing protein [Tanacetum coccineum]|uniref:Reverse transcriptase domain-containing protein n=1 Tax=Tanacetum coccineum TaxID=301880 RepID=A0ABQ4ZC10_9ASTR
MSAYPNPGFAGLFADLTGCVTLFVRWIEDYPLPDRLKMPSHVGSYDEKGDPDNYLHLFKGAIHMQIWAMPVACHKFTYTLKDSGRIWWNSQKAGSILNYKDLKAKFRSYFIQQKKSTKTHLVVHNIKQREGKSTRAVVTRYTDDTLQILGLHKDQRISVFVHGLRTRNLVEFLSIDRLTTYKGLMEKTYTWIEAREVATNRAPNDRREGFDRSRKNPSWNNNKGQKNIDKFFSYRRYCHFHEDHGYATNDCRELRHQIEEAGEWKKEDKDTTPVEAPIFMISRRDPTTKRKLLEELTLGFREITFPPDAEHCFLKLKPSIKTLIVDSKVLLVGFQESIPGLSERSNSLHNLLLGRMAMQKMGEGTKKLREVSSKDIKGILSCIYTVERIVVNSKYPEQTVIIGKKLLANFKERLQDLLRSNADVFAWTYADMTGILRTITVGGKPFNTEHKLNEYMHIKSVKQKKRGLGPNRNAAACKEVEEPMKAGILQKAYVDDMVIKSTSEEDMQKDIQETFERFWSINMKLNPKKCSFGVEEGPFLGHLITKQGIRANPSKFKAVTDLEPPRTLKDVQSLNRKLAALSRFLSKGTEKSLPFFKMLKSCTDKRTIQWTMDVEEAF